MVKKMHVRWKWYVFFVHFFPEHASFVLMFPVFIGTDISADTAIMINESPLFHTSGALYNYLSVFIIFFTLSLKTNSTGRQ